MRVMSCCLARPKRHFGLRSTTERVVRLYVFFANSTDHRTETLFNINRSTLSPQKANFFAMDRKLQEKIVAEKARREECDYPVLLAFS